MDTAATLRAARTAAGLSQRDLARQAGIPQPTVSRIERGHHVPRVDTLARLLKTCGHRLAVADRRGEGVDRTLIRHWLAMTPRQRAEQAAAYGRAATRLAAGRQ